MKKRSVFLPCFCLALTLLSSACELLKKSPEEILTAYAWELSLLRVDSDCDGAYDMTHTPEGCPADDLLIFEADGTLLYDDGDWPCTSNSSQTSTVGYWSLTSDNTTLLIEYFSNWSGIPEVLEIEKLSEHELVVSGTDFLSISCVKGRFHFIPR